MGAPLGDDTLNLFLARRFKEHQFRPDAQALAQDVPLEPLPGRIAQIDARSDDRPFGLMADNADRDSVLPAQQQKAVEARSQARLVHAQPVNDSL